MLTLFVIVSFVFLCIGMAVSVYAFGTGGKRAHVFKDIYFSIENVDGIGVVYTKTGEFSAILRMENPVQKYSADVESYYALTALMTSILQTLGEGYALPKQDIFARKHFDMKKVSARRDPNADTSRLFLSDSYFRFMDGRPYTDGSTYLVITQECKKSALLSYDASKWRDFTVKIRKVYDQLKDGGVAASFLDANACRQYADRFFAQDFTSKVISIYISKLL